MWTRCLKRGGSTWCVYRLPLRLTPTRGSAYKRGSVTPSTAVFRHSHLTEAMKTERRHELQTNTLAQHLAEWIEKIKPYSTAITVVIGAVIIVAIVAAYLAQSKSAADQAAWDKFTYAMTSYPPQIEGLDSIFRIMLGRKWRNGRH